MKCYKMYNFHEISWNEAELFTLWPLCEISVCLSAGQQLCNISIGQWYKQETMGWQNSSRDKDRLLSWEVIES